MEKISLWGLGICLIAFGVWPSALLDFIDPITAGRLGDLVAAVAMAGGAP